MSDFIYESSSDPGYPPAPPPPTPSPAPNIDSNTRETWDYLMEVIADYETFLHNIGHLGYSAPQLLYYRDEVQEFLDELAGRTDINTAGAWKKVTELDTLLRSQSQTLVDEIGHKNFVQYQIQNDPPRTHWWWWLNRVTSPPPPAPKMWEFWKHLNLKPTNVDPPAPQPASNQGPARDPKIAQLFERPKDEQP